MVVGGQQGGGSDLRSFQIDVFEQQLRSISKIDFMERFLSEVRPTAAVGPERAGTAAA